MFITHNNLLNRFKLLIDFLFLFCAFCFVFFAYLINELFIAKTTIFKMNKQDDDQLIYYLTLEN